MKKLLKVSILAALFAQSVHAAEFRVLAYGEHVGTDIVYHYTLVNNGLGMPRKFTIGVKDTGNADYDAWDRHAPGIYNTPPEFHRTLTRKPIGLTFIPHERLNYPSEPVLAPGSVGVPALPSGWQANALAEPDALMNSVEWIAPATAAKQWWKLMYRPSLHPLLLLLPHL